MGSLDKYSRGISTIRRCESKEGEKRSRSSSIRSFTSRLKQIVYLSLSGGNQLSKANPRSTIIFMSRPLCLAVTKRRVCGGSRSMARFEQTADLLSVIQTCRFQSRSATTFFREAISAGACHFTMPSLLPLFQTPMFAACTSATFDRSALRLAGDLAENLTLSVLLFLELMLYQRLTRLKSPSCDVSHHSRRG
jgi:hypothetical protein